MNKIIEKILFLIICFSLVLLKPLTAQNWEWAEQVGSVNSDQFESIAIANNQIYSIGLFRGTASFRSSPGAENNLVASLTAGGFVACHSLAGVKVWANVIETTTEIQLKGIFSDATGNIYITGSYSGTQAIFHSINSANNITLGASQNHDAFIAKYDSNGNLLFASVVAQSSNLDRGFGIQVDALGNIYIGGFWRGGTINFLGSSISVPYVSSDNWGNGFVAKFNSSFVPLWVATIVGSADGAARINGGISLAPNNGIYGSGPFYKQIYFDKTYLADGSSFSHPNTIYNAGTTAAQDVIAFKLNSDGTLDWARHIANNNLTANSGNAISSDTSTGDVFIIGNFGSNINIGNAPGFDPVVLTSKGGEDNFVVAYNVNGQIKWTYSFGSGGTSNELINSVSYRNGVVSTGGMYRGVMYLGQTTAVQDTLTILNTGEAFLVNLSAENGNYLGAVRVAGSLGNEETLTVKLDAQGNTMVGGYFASPSIAIGSATLTNTGVQDGFMAKHINFNIHPVTSNVTCFNGEDGTLSINISGGYAAPLSYVLTLLKKGTISSGIYTQPLLFEDLKAGTYKLVLTDNLGRVVTKYYHITQPNKITTTAVINPIVKNEFGVITSNGSITQTVTGGTPGYTYQWDHGGFTTKDISGLSQDKEYTVTITDARGCSMDTSYFVPVEGVFAIYLQSKADVSCHGGNNGAATVLPNAFGVAPITYQWSGPSGILAETTNSASNLEAGNYTVLATDSDSKTYSISFTILQPLAPLSASIINFPPICYNEGNGKMILSRTGGTRPFSYIWKDELGNTISISKNLYNIPSGVYSIYITDANGCEFSIEDHFLEQPAQLAATFNTTYVSCYNGNYGIIQVNPSGGTGAHQFSLNGGPFQSSNIFSGLPQGTYSITIIDDNNCSRTFESIIITQPSQIVVNPIANSPTCPESTNGSIGISVTGGTGVKTFIWTGPGISNPFQQNQSDLGIGTYNVRVTDENECFVDREIILTAANPSPIAELVSTEPSNTICQGSPITFNASGGVTYEFYLNDELVKGPGPSSYYTSNALQNNDEVYAVVFSSAGCRAISPLIAVTVNPLPFAYTITGGGGYCQGTVGTTIGLSGSQTGVNYQLLLNGAPIGDPLSGNGLSLDFGNQIAEGTYTVMATYATTLCEQIMNGSTTVSINPLPVVNVPADFSICSGNEALLNATGTADTYDWDNGVVNNIPFIPTEPTTYTVIGTITATGCQQTAQVQITLEPSPTPTIATTHPLSYCEGQTIATTLTVAPAGDAYQWFRNGEPIDGATTSSYIATQEGMYTAEVTIGNCTGSSNALEILIKSIPNPTISTVDRLGWYENENIEVLLLTDIDDADNYQWLLNLNPISDANSSTYSANTSGTYAVEVTINGCTGVSNSIDIITLSNPIVAIDDYFELLVNGNITANVLTNDEGLVGSNLVVNIEVYVTKGMVQVNSDNTLTYTPDYHFAGHDSITYRVCDEYGNCGTAKARFYVKTERLIIPEGFSPDGDNINDTFQIIGLEQLGGLSVKIYNRSGILVYSNSDYKNDWDGTSNAFSVGKTLPNGTYYYFIEVGSTKEKYSGNVFLKR